MKKIFIVITATTLALALAGCGAEDASITDLSNQLDKTSHTISSLQTTDPAKIALQGTSEQTSSLAGYARQALVDEEYYKTDILDKTSQIKQTLSLSKTLSKSQSSALGDLIADLETYTTSAKELHDKVDSTLKAVSSLKKDTSKNKDRLNAKLTKLANNSNARASYYENILHTLDEIDSCINTDSFSIENTTQNKSTKNNQQTDKKETVDSSDEKCEECDNQFADKTKEYRSRYGEFAQKRNIDTYGPSRRNVDTYGFNNRFLPYNQNAYMPYNPQMMPNNPYGYGWNGHPYYNSNNFNRYTNPINKMYMPASTQQEDKPRLETYEQTNEDGAFQKIESPATIEKISSPSNCEDCAKVEQDNSQSAVMQTSAMPVKSKNYQNLPKNNPKTAKHNPNDQIIVAHDNV